MISVLVLAKWVHDYLSLCPQPVTMISVLVLAKWVLDYLSLCPQPVTMISVLVLAKWVLDYLSLRPQPLVLDTRVPSPTSQYWAVYVGWLTPLTFTQHHLNPLAVFTSCAYFLHSRGSWQWIHKVYGANFQGILGSQSPPVPLWRHPGIEQVLNNGTRFFFLQIHLLSSHPVLPVLRQHHDGRSFTGGGGRWPQAVAAGETHQPGCPAVCAGRGGGASVASRLSPGLPQLPGGEHQRLGEAMGGEHALMNCCIAVA